MTILAIDCGLRGGLATGIEVFDPPTEKVWKSRKRNKVTGEMEDKYRTVYNIPELIKLIKDINPSLVVLEYVHGRLGDGAIQAFNFGLGFGMYQGILHTLEIPIIMVSPQQWKKDLKLINLDKEASRQLALKLFPDLVEQLSRKKDEGRAETLLIYYWYKHFYKDK